MTFCKSVFCLLAINIFFATNCWSQPNDWVTYCEKSDFKRTPRYAETSTFFQKLAEASPFAEMKTFGRSGENRELKVLILSEDLAFTPKEAQNTGKPVILIANCIHPGESAGKDASMMLARDLLILKKYPQILEKAILLFIPILNPDGHEQFGPYNRINQIGPEEMGWRVNATRLNLNRDFMKAETPEIRAWLDLYNRWLPHLFIDCHTTDGADFQYTIQYYIDDHPEFGGAVSEWAREYFVPQLVNRCEKAGHLILPYAGLIDEKHPDKGLRSGVWPPRLSNIYATLRNRAGLLLEAHSLKDYKTRVLGSHIFLLAAINTIIEKPDLLLNAVKAEDERCLNWGKSNSDQQFLPFSFEITSRADSFLYRDYQVEFIKGAVSEIEHPVYRPIPVNIPTVFYHYVTSQNSVIVPQGYLIPQQWREVIEILHAHGVKLYRLTDAVQDTFEFYRLEDEAWGSKTYEGHNRVSFKQKLVREEKNFPAGTLYVPIGQKAAKILMHLLEPEAPDALIRWGYFNPIFEQKEYFETYTMEPYAQKMIQDNSQLKIEFEEKLKSDSSFAANGRERLMFFYRRSPYWDFDKNLYPVARIVNAKKFPIDEKGTD